MDANNLALSTGAPAVSGMPLFGHV